MAQQAKLLPTMPTSDPGVLVSVLTALLPSSYLLMCLGKKAVADDPGTWTPTTHVADLEVALGSRLQYRPVLAVAAIWEVKQQMDDLLLSLSASVTLPFK